jgi:transcription elongation factor GreA
VIKKNRSKAKSVCLGCRVLVQNGRNSQEFCIVGEWEADPTNKKISHTSPLGQALLGKCKGEKVEVAAPAGKIVYKILEIE